MNLNDGRKYTDFSYLRTISKGNTRFQQKMLTTFIKQSAEDIKKLKLAIGERNWEAVFMIAHKMKPSLHFVGLNMLLGDLLSLEILAKSMLLNHA
jgi:HPt (histidine-containing phosphotransfer) domain-containing protein